MHAVSIQEVTSLADSYDVPLICADLQVSNKQSKWYLENYVEPLYSGLPGTEEIDHRREVTVVGR